MHVQHKYDEDRARPETSPVQREVQLFLILFWVTAIIPLVVIFLRDGWSGESAAALGVVVAFAVWLHLVFRIHEPFLTVWRFGPTVAMLGGLYLGVAGLIFLDESFTFALFGLYSLTFSYAGTFVRGLAFSFVLTLIWAGGWAYHDTAPGMLATPFFVWVTSNVISFFIYQITTRSEERGRLLEEIAATRDQLAAEERARGVMEERARVAGEIHDTLAQGFTSIVLLSKGTAARAGDISPEALLDNLNLIESTARENLAEARRLVEALRPAALDGSTLSEAIHRLGARHTERTGVRVDVSVGGRVVPLGGTGDVVLLRTVQEALANARKHADAERICIELDYTHSGATLRVQDDGVGFDLGSAPAAIDGDVGGEGLGIMRDRVVAANGTVDIETSPGEGCTLTVRVPATDHSAFDSPASGLSAADQVGEKYSSAEQS